MQDSAILLDDAKQRLDELRTFNVMRVAQGESPPPAWLQAPEGERFIAALERDDVDEAVAIYAAACDRAFDDWTDLLWQARGPAPKEEAR